VTRAGRSWLALLALLALTAAALVVLPSQRAAAAAGDLRLTLTQDVASSRIGTPLTLTATLFQDDGDGGSTPVAGTWAVEFSGTGDGGWRSGPVPTVDGRATYGRTAPVGQQETVTATLVAAGCSAAVSNAVTHTWWVPQLKLTPVDGANTAVNGSATLAVDLTHDGTGIQGTVLVNVDVTAYTQNPVPASHRFEVHTDANGHGVTDSWPGNQTTMELVTAVEETTISPARAWTTHRFGGAGSFAHPELSVKSVSVRAGTTVHAEAQFGHAEFIVSNGAVTWSDPPSTPETTDSLGHTTHDYRRSSASAWAIAVFSATEGMEGTAGVWWVPTITLSAPNRSSITGERFTQTAVVSHDGRPVPGATLHFAVSSDSADPEPQDVGTDANGVAAFSWTRNQPGTDTVTVDEITAGVTDAPSVATTHVWTEAPSAPIEVTTRQSGGSGRAGTSVDVAAHVAMGADALTDVPVTFTDDLGNRLGGDSTDRAGDAEIRYTNRRVGTERITVSASLGDCRIRAASLDIDRWVPTLDLAPKNATSTAGGAVSMTATLKHGADPVVGETIDVTSHSTSCTLDDLTPSASTDSRGEATVTLTRATPSVDAVIAVDRTTAVAAVPRATTHTWGQRPDPPLVVSLDRTSAGDRVGTDATVRVQVTNAGKAASGAEVTVLGLAADPIRLPTADADGRTSYSYRRDMPQTETIVATAALGCDSSNPSTKRHEWWAPVLRLTPHRDSATTGTTAHAVAVLSHGRDALSGAAIDFTVSGSSGPALDRPNVRTDDRGRAEITWTRQRPGTDTITAVEEAKVLPATDRSEQEWTTPPDTRRLTLDATPERSSGSVGRDFSVDASTELGGVHTAGVLIRLHASMPGASDVDLADETSSSGKSAFRYRRDIPGTEVITVTATYGDKSVQRTLTRVWSSPSPPTLQLSVTPPDSSSTIDTSAHLNAHLTVGLQPAANVMVDFTARLAGQPDISGRGLTTVAGDATFDWIRPATGVETITVRAVVDGRSVTKTVRHTWTDRPTQQSTSPTPTSPSPTPTPTPTPTPPPTPTPTPKVKVPTDPTTTAVTGPEVGAPGGDLAVGGSGCRPGQTVRIYLGRTQLGATTAARDGTFSLRAAVPELPLGRYTLHTSCGRTTGDPNVDITRPQVDRGAGQIAAAGITTGSTFLFFLLIAKSIVSFLPSRRGW
jgi:hypothetical protein